MASQLDIARKVGISQTVVSRVLSGNWEQYKIATKTVEKIQQAAKELRYEPNRAANIVFGRKTHLIGVVVPSFHAPFFGVVLDEINERAAADNLGVVVAGLSGYKDPMEAVRFLQGYRPDALIVAGTVDFSEWTEYLSHADRKVIQIGLASDHPQVITCGTCEQVAANMQIEHLLDLGHRNVGFVMDRSRTSEVRLSALQNALQKNGLEIISDMTVDGCDISGESDPERLALLLQAIRERRITAVVCAGDLIAAGLIRNLIQAGIRVPEDVSLSSYNDVPLAAILNPPLTTVHLPVRELVAAAMDIVAGRLPEKSVERQPVLVVRGSTALLSPVG